MKTSVNWLAFVAPAGVVTTLSQCKSLPAAMDAAAVFGLGLSLTGVMTDFIKNYCGIFRPNYFHACGWNGTACTPAAAKYTSPHDGRKSFPSGHSSNAAAAATVLTLYLLRTVAALDAAAQSLSLIHI